MTLIDKIQAHNEVNGFLFSAVEFVVIALVALPFGVYYLTHGRLVAGGVGVGIAANALTVTAFAIYSLRSRQKDIGILAWFTKEGRKLIAGKYPGISSDTMVLTVVTLLPFIMLLGCGYELLFKTRPARGD